MKLFKVISVMTVVALAVLIAVPQTTYAQVENPEDCPNFVDEDGDGYNDNAPDTDGDGIPNGLDEDYEGGAGQGFGGSVNGAGFVDEDGDGFNYNAADSDGDGIPNGQDEDFVPGSGTDVGRGAGQGFLD